MNARAGTGGLTVGGISVLWREQPRPGDAVEVRRITESSGFFNAADAGLPPAETLGYSCFGPIPCTQLSFDLYWIAVEQRCRYMGLGAALLAESETIMKRMGGKRIYVETSSRGLYEPTRLFYGRRGYRQEALIADFYAPGDGKVIYVKELK
jgi:ribosomal protein S18 acetylase RimI-like enzyme